MGWPLAVSAGLMERSSRALVAALGPLSVGHLLAMLLVLLPFALLVTLVEWQRQIQIGASLLVIGFGIFRFVDRRHPRGLARIRPTQLGLCEFDGEPVGLQHHGSHHFDRRLFAVHLFHSTKSGDPERT
jgi:hypothetical protein